MLNANYKEQVLSDLNKVDKEYQKEFQKAIFDMERLQEQRERAVMVIKNVDAYVTQLANQPRGFETQIGTINSRCIRFLNEKNKIEKLEQQNRCAKELSEKFGTAGTLLGTGVMTLGPTAAMSVAMTFGTTSTGTAIASLSGAAATNAALAWLGGGTVATGGLGVAGGNAVVSLTGPVGWILGGVIVAGSLMAINSSNKEMAEQAEKSVRTIKKEINRIKKIDTRVLEWNGETKKLSNEISRCLLRLKNNHKKDYNNFTENEINELISLFNVTEVLSKKIGKTIQGEME